MTKEQEKAIETMKRFINSTIDTTAVTAKDMKEVLNLIQTQQEEIEKKDKITDEMLEEYEYNARINIKNFCDEEMRRNTCIQDCKECIKQYFERKIEQ